MPTSVLPFLQIEPTTRCNLRCRFCAGRHLPQVNMSLDLFKEIVHTFNGIAHIELQGEGEPLLAPHFFAMLDYLQTAMPQVAVSTITNGLLMPREVEWFILLTHLKLILISLESAHPEHYHRIRGGNLQTLIEGIGLLTEVKQSSGTTSPKIGFSVTVMKDTFGELNGIAQLYRELLMDGGITYQRLQIMPHYTKYYTDDISHQIPQQQEMFSLQVRIKKSPELRTGLLQAQNNGGFYAKLYDKPGNAWQICPWLEKGGLFVTAEGQVMSCCFIKDASRFSLGRIGKETAGEMLARAHTLLQQRQAGKIPENCRGCALVR